MKRKLAEQLVFTLLGLSVLLIVAPVLYIIYYIVVSGGGAITWEFLTGMPSKRGLEGGIFPALVGTFYIVLGTLLFSLPVGVLAAVYLTEYAKQNWLTKLINTAIVNLAGVPSIIYGLFGLSLFVLTLGFGSSIISASLTLACLVLPLVITASREALLAVPKEYRDASLALGVSKWSTIRNVILPAAFPGIITGTVLAIGLAAGETAPILAVGAAFLLPRLPQSPFDQFMALPYHLYIVATQVPGMPSVVMWGVALVLLGFVLAFNSAAVLLRLYYRRRLVRP